MLTASESRVGMPVTIFENFFSYPTVESQTSEGEESHDYSDDAFGAWLT
jgi:hypothetical protein